MAHWWLCLVACQQQDLPRHGLSYLNESSVRAAFPDLRIRERLYGAWTLFLLFLCQVNQMLSCRQTIEKGIQQKWLPKDASTNTGAYCNARKALPEAPLQQLVLGYGQSLESSALPVDQFFGRSVLIVDGSSTQLPDTLQNQASYPQPSEQKQGCGFPVMYFVALMFLASGAVFDIAFGTTGQERSMFRKLWRSLKAGCIVLGDAGFGSYAEIAMLVLRGADAVFRESKRKFDSTGARRLGPGDRLVTLLRPADPGAWVDPKELPETLPLREIQFVCHIRGFRSKSIRLITTLLDPVLYPKKQFIKLYARRWEMELRLRDIKTTMRLDKLTCKTPAGCRKELLMGVMAYNLIRTVLLDAARRFPVLVSRISFAGALHRLIETASGALIHEDPPLAYQLLLRHLADDLVPLRPHRVEPRKRKQRYNDYPILNRPRYLERATLCKA